MQPDGSDPVKGSEFDIDLASIIDAWPEPVRIMGLGGELLHINPAGHRASAIEDFELYRGKPWSIYWHRQTRPDVEAAIAAAAAGGMGRFRASRYNLAGARQWLDNVVSPIRNRQGKVVRLMGLSRDISEAMEQQTFLHTLIDLLPNPVIAKRADDGQYVLVNRAAEAAFGTEAEDWLGKTAFDLFPEHEARGFREEDQRVIASREMRVSEEEAVTTPAGLRYFTTKKFATYDGDRPLHLISLGEDVTHRREAAATMRDALAEAERLNRSKSEFLANMSHEIRTPLNGIVAGVDMLARSGLDGRARELVEIIDSSAATLERLLSDILDLARIEAGRVSLETTVFHLGDVIRSTAALAKLRADEKGVALCVKLSPEVEATFEGDPHRIRQVLTNLLNNAVKFTEQGSVTVSATIGPSGEGVRVEVRDTGIGFSPEQKEAIFGRFQQGDGSITRRFGGTGLGMTISRELIAMMGGELDAEGREGEGATFWFILPLPRAAAEPEEEHAAPTRAPDRRLRILLADDHPTNRQVVHLMLAGLADVASVENGRDAVITFGAGEFDVILMDMQMPVMDGLAATRRIRDSERRSGRRRTPVIMLTANALPEHVAASVAAGADRHLEKPVTLASLLDAIGELLDAADDDGDMAEAV